ncbi:MAG: hypothetical protein WCG44_04875 [bacterium]
MPEATDFIKPSSKLKSVLKVLGIVVLSILVYLGAAVATGFISAFSSNIETSTFNIIFDSQITIAYLLMYYSLSHFNKTTEGQNYFLFVVTLLLSFTTNFIQGAFTLLVLPPLLTKLGLISSSK